MFRFSSPKDEDWTLWGATLGIEGKTILPFLTACFGCTAEAYRLNLLNHKICFRREHLRIPRCKMIKTTRPKAAIHENVEQCPAEELLDYVLGHFVQS